MEETHEQFLKRIENEQNQELKSLKENPLFSVVNMRISDQKLYYYKKFKEFSEILTENTGFKRVEFGRQDGLRSGFSISLINEDTSKRDLKYFETSKELLSFVEGFLRGYNQALLF